MIRQHFELQDSEILSGIAREKGFDIHSDQLESGQLFGVVDFAGTTNAQFFRNHFGRAICIHGTVPTGMVAFAFPATPADSSIFCGEVATSRTLCLITTGDEHSYRTTANHKVFGGCFAAKRLDGALRSLHHTSLARVLPHTGNLEIPATAMARMHSVMQSAFVPPPHPDQALDRDALDHAVEDRLLSALCSALTAKSSPGPARLAARNHWRCVRKARDYIEAHLSVTPRMEILCLYVGVSERTLEAAFRKVTGFSPLQFIKVRRLNAARRALKTAHPQETSVKAIALNFGFGHFGHFAHDYKAHFSESPSATLCRR